MTYTYKNAERVELLVNSIRQQSFARNQTVSYLQNATGFDDATFVEWYIAQGLPIPVDIYGNVSYGPFKRAGYTATSTSPGAVLVEGPGIADMTLPIPGAGADEGLGIQTQAQIAGAAMGAGPVGLGLTAGAAVAILVVLYLAWGYFT